MTTNLERGFAARPEAFAAWKELNGAVSDVLVVGRPIANA